MKTMLTMLVVCIALALAAQSNTQADHHAGVVQRGESHAGMGFSQTTTTHHFILTLNGGIVQVTANDPNNTEQIETIQMHLKHIAVCSQRGTSRFLTLCMTKRRQVSTMKELKDAIRYSTETLGNGGQVKIETRSPDGIAAIHDFLRFQIKDHETGDATTCSNSP